MIPSIYVSCRHFFMNMSYLGDGLTNAVVFDWLGLGEMEDLDLGSVTCEGLL